MSERDLIFLCVEDEKRSGEKEEYEKEGDGEGLWSTWEEMGYKGAGMGCGGTNWEHSLLRV